MEKHFYEQLKIENFRGIKSLEINDLARINLFVGRNNCGKTSVLESIFLLTGILDPIYHIDHMEKHRKLTLNENSDLKSFFYNQKYTKGFRLFGKERTGSREINVVPSYGSFNRDRGERGTVQTGVLSSTTEQSLSTLKFILTHSTKENRPYETTINLVTGDTSFNFKSEEDYREITYTCFLGQTYGLEMVDRMLNEKRKDVLVSRLQSIEPKVKDIRIGLDRIVMIDIGTDNFLPINHLGGGMVHVLNILSAIYWVRNGILVIDEIENGLHVSSIKYMWEMVLESSKQNNTQIFMTTHSSDVIKSLSLALQDKADSVACFWLSKFDDDRIKAYRYSPDDLENALDVGIDIRH